MSAETSEVITHRLHRSMTPSNDVIFGRNVARLRRARSWNHDQFALLVSMNPEDLKLLELGNVRLRADLRERITKALECDPEELLLS
jgi:DNA-binding Xre family transcriptional regulator